MKIVITHGTKGSPLGNWFPWLGNALKDCGHTVTIPSYPTPERQDLTTWLSAFDNEFGFSNLNSDTILIGHSLGVAFTLRVLQEAKESVRACFFVAGFIRVLGIPEYDELNRSFISSSFDWSRLRAQAGLVHVYHSENDPYVPLKFGEEIAAALGVKINLIPGGGHLNSESGMAEFPRLLTDLKSVLNKAK